jgi:hypothetical protein
LANIWNLIHIITSCSSKLIFWRTLSDLSLFNHKVCGVEILDWSLWRPDRLIKVSFQSIPHLIYLKINIIQPKHQKKDNITRSILHPFLSDLLLPDFKSFTADHKDSCSSISCFFSSLENHGREIISPTHTYIQSAANKKFINLNCLTLHVWLCLIYSDSKLK